MNKVYIHRFEINDANEHFGIKYNTNPVFYLRITQAEMMTSPYAALYNIVGEKVAQRLGLIDLALVHMEHKPFIDLLSVEEIGAFYDEVCL